MRCKGYPTPPIISELTRNLIMTPPEPPVPWDHQSSISSNVSILSTISSYTDPGCFLIDFSKYVPDRFLYNHVDKVISTMVIPCVAVFGVISKVSFLIVVWRLKRMRNATNFYLANLAVADMLFLVTASTHTILNYLDSPIRNADYVGVPGCSSILAMYSAWFYASIAIVTLVTVERYYAILYPLKHRLLSTKRRAVIIITCIWLLSFVLGISHIPVVSELGSFCVIWPEDDARYDSWPRTFVTCLPSPPWTFDAMHIFMDVVYFVIFLLNSILCLVIIRALISRHKNITTNQVTTRHQHTISRVNIQVTRMLIGNCTVYFICQSPFRLFTVYWMYCTYQTCPAADPNTISLIMLISEMLLYVNSTLNPMIYNFGSARYRTAFRETYSCHHSSASAQSVGGYGHHATVKRLTTSPTCVTQLDNNNVGNVVPNVVPNVAHFETCV